MACSAHLLSQSLYSSHRASPAAPRNLRSQARPPARASPAARPGASVRGCRGLSLRVAASFDQERRQVEVSYDPQAKFNQLADQIDKDAGMTRLNLFSPCKINVFLRITGKRPDGFHDLASLFHVISLGDTIKFSLSPSKSRDRLSTNVPGVPVDESNLIIKALNLYRQKTGTDNFFWVLLIAHALLSSGGSKIQFLGGLNFFFLLFLLFSFFFLLLFFFLLFTYVWNL